MEQTDSIKTFTEKFFTNLKCTLDWKDNVLVVSNIPKNFEDFAGRPQPYLLVFDKSYENDSTELMIKGSHLLKTMMDYLEGRGQTTLLKIVSHVEPKEAFLHNFSLNNCSIAHITKKQDYKIIPRFTFLSILQYLNQRESVSNSLYVKDGSIIDANLDKFSSLEGRKEDIGSLSLDDSYLLAKNNVKSLMDDKLQSVKNQLKEKIDVEINRIHQHYEQQIKEHENTQNKINQQIINLEKENSKGRVENYESRMAKLKEALRSFQQSDVIDKVRKEESFFINDEIHKHGLSVNHKLINTTIFYYPVYTLNLFLKGTNGGRIVEVTYDFIFNEWSKLNCDVCAKEINELSICSSGHLGCIACIKTCRNCNSDACSKCMDKVCSRCNREICRKCAIKCANCSNYCCKEHLYSLTGTYGVCSSCSVSCAVCYKKGNPKQMHKNGSTYLCQACHNNKIQKQVTKVFEK